MPRQFKVMYRGRIPYVSGVIEENSLFHVVGSKDEDLITCPNNLILQKAAIRITADKAVSTEENAIYFVRRLI